MKPSKHGWGLFRCRECLVPTLRGWIVLWLIGAGLVVFAMREIHPFLSVNDPIPGGVLVVEGWLPDYALEETIAQFRRDHSRSLYVTGGSIEHGAPLAQYRSSAELCAATLVRLGLDTDVVQAVPAPKVRRDRTYASAVALKDWLSQHGTVATNINVISMGPHARRTRLLFSKALGNGYRVGVICIEDRGYDPKKWWESSAGVRAVTGETIAYCYARLLFRPPTQPD